MSAAPEVSRSHLPHLDGLRGVAVLLVLVEHFTYNDWLRGWSPGSMGVRTFFVLSGFLITGLLLADRDRLDAGTVARRFFRNRALRLLPAFFLAVALAAVLGIADMRQDWPWHLAYLSNVEIWLERRWSGAGHFWTLAVEQQFYLLWFPVVVLLPRRWLLPVVALCLVTGPAIRIGIAAGGTEFLNVLFPAQADALALGALLAVAMRSVAGRAVIDRLARPWLLWGAVLLLVALSAPVWERPAVLSWVVQPSVIACVAALTLCTVIARPARLGWLLAPWLVHLGRMSYGLYLFHYLVPQALNLHVPFVAGLTEGPEKLLRVAIWLVLSIVAAELSWRFVEQPALRLKQGAVWRNVPKPAVGPTVG